MDTKDRVAHAVSMVRSGLARLRTADPRPVETRAVAQKALVIGGGIAGLTAALAIADHGFPVDLVEQTETLGGNLQWLGRTLAGEYVGVYLADACRRVEKHPHVTVHTQSRLVHGEGQVGAFISNIEDAAGQVTTIDHGVTILATGGQEAPTASYGHGSLGGVVTQKALEARITDGTLDAEMGSIVMILCVESREEPRNYCSRVCCGTALKHALALKKEHPDMAVTILYRDMMTTGFSESCYTEARRQGVLFIRYTPDRKPAVAASGPDEPRSLQVSVWEPLLERQLSIHADMVVLATGVVPVLPGDVAAAYAAVRDVDGFFQEAESKWRPVDSLAEGVFACGLCHSPKSIDASVASAEAAAQRSLRILNHEALPAGVITAKVRQSLCTLCLRCIDDCPYGARSVDIDAGAIAVNPAMCQGCGACAATCPNGASILEGYSKRVVMGMIDAAFAGSVTVEG